MTLDEHWRTSSRSGTNGDCIEVRLVDGIVEVRDSKNRAGGAQRYDVRDWQAFLNGVKSTMT